MTKYRAGDKITVEYELVEGTDLYAGGVAFIIPTTSGLNLRINVTENTKLLKIISHTPKPIELAAGQTWKRVGTAQRVQVMHVDPVNHDGGRRRFVVSRFMTDIPVSNFYDDFLRAHEYVSG